MDAKYGWALRVPLTRRGSGSGSREHPVTARFLGALPLIRKAIATLPDGERSWASSCYGKQSYLEAFEGWDRPDPATILDLGCGDGFLTCFYGRLHPCATVFGLDRSPNSVARAGALARALGVDNVTFIEGDMEDLGSVLEGRTFDLVTSSCALRPRVRATHSWPGERLDVTADERAAAIAGAIRCALTPQGIFVSTEVWKIPAELRCWASVLASSGLAVDWEASRAVRLDDADFQILWVLLAARVGQGARSLTLEEAEAFLVRAELETREQQAVLRGHAAEALFQRLAPRRLLHGYQAECPDGSAWRRELWEVGPVIVSFDYTNGDDREIMFWPRRAEVVLRSALETEEQNLLANRWQVTVTGSNCRG